MNCKECGSARDPGHVNDRDCMVALMADRDLLVLQNDEVMKECPLASHKDHKNANACYFALLWVLDHPEQPEKRFCEAERFAEDRKCGEALPCKYHKLKCEGCGEPEHYGGPGKSCGMPWPG